MRWLQVPAGGGSYQGGRETEESASSWTFGADSEANPCWPCTTAPAAGNCSTCQRRTGRSERPLVNHPLRKLASL